MVSHGFARAGHLVSATHYSSHLNLLQRHIPGGQASLQGIIVSAARPARFLRPALRLGGELDVPVVIMCSHEARVNEVVALTEDVAGATAVVVALSQDVAPPEELDKRLPRFETSAFGTPAQQDRLGLHGDLSRKRNLGLALGRLAGWRTMLFLDDDIVGLDPNTIRRAAATLDHSSAVGMLALDFPDNSVVCHAHRRAGGEQEVFVGGSALAVNLRDTDTFFPEVYNEDWLFLAPHLDRKAVGCVGSVRQLEYHPFEDPRRAAAQEFGEVVAEGLIGYLHSARLHPPPRVDYWEAFLESRAAFIAGAKRGCLERAEQDPTARAALAALEAAEQALAMVAATDVVRYIAAWAHDLKTWHRYLGALPVQTAAANGDLTSRDAVCRWGCRRSRLSIVRV